MLYEIALWIAAAGFAATGLWAVRVTTRRLIAESEARIAEWHGHLPEELLAAFTIGGRQRERTAGIVAGLDAGEAVAA